MKKLTAILAAALAGLMLFAGCSANGGWGPYPDANSDYFAEDVGGNYDYESVIEQPFYETAEKSEHYLSLIHILVQYICPFAGA